MSEESKPRPWTPEEIEQKGLAPWKVAPSSDSQPAYLGPQILHGHLKGFFETFVYHPDPRVHNVLTAWTLHTWHYRKFRASPPLYLLGPVSSGKTTVLECLAEVAYRGVRGGSMSNASMFRLSEWAGPSLLIDEAQLYNRDEWAESQSFLNERYRKGGRVTRVEQLEGKGFRIVYFNAYGPTALAASESSWEAMISRAIVINMEKGRAPQKTLTNEFEDQGQKLRAWLAQYAESFEPLAAHEREDIIDPAEQALIEKGKLDRKEPDLFPIPDLSMFEDGRLVEKVEPLLACSPIGEPRENILSFARDMARKQEANENTSYLVEYLQAYLACIPDRNGKIGTKQIRAQLATARECTINDKGMPSSKFVTKCLDTLGFERTRLNDGSPGFMSNTGHEDRVQRRYQLGKYAPADHSDPSESFRREEKNLNDPNNPNDSGRTYRGTLDK